jgi:hypothetical protein
MLVDAGADVNATAATGRTPLIVAASSPGMHATVKMLLERDTNWKAADKMGKNALVARCRRRQLRIGPDAGGPRRGRQLQSRARRRSTPRGRRESGHRHGQVIFSPMAPKWTYGSAMRIRCDTVRLRSIR